MARKRLSKSSLLWFIRSRSYVSIADIRRRFAIEGGDEVVPLQGPQAKVFVGLPAHQARLLQDLWQEGKVGLELVADINARSVSGVYSMYGRREPTAVPPEMEVEDEPSAAMSEG